MNQFLRVGLLIACCLPFLNVVGQNADFCGTDYLQEQSRALNPELYDRIVAEDNDKYVKYIHDRHQGLISNTRANCDVYKIPVAVHIVHSGNSISDARIQTEINRINENYRRLPNTSGFGQGVDTRIQFALAQLDPQGNPTTGITRHQNAALAQHDYGNGTNDEYNALTSLAHWANCMNIYVVNSIDPLVPAPGTILGYGPLPWFTQYNKRSMVVIANAVGGFNGALLDLTVTHEIGHWMGLLHPFQFGCAGSTGASCLTGGDQVCDTRQADMSRETCNNVNSCDDSPCDYGDSEDNYMGYTACANAFTEGQAERLYFYLDGQLSYLWDPANLTATGLGNFNTIYSQPEPAFTASQTIGCEGTTITFTDETMGCVENYNWIFPGGSPINSNDPNPVVTYNTPGEYPVQLTVSNTGGFTNSITKTAHIKIANTGVVPPYTESFESSSFVPSGWKIVDEAGDGGWERKTLIASEGNASASFPAFSSNSCNSNDYLISPLIDLTNIYNASIKFDYAYLAYSASQDEADQLVVQVVNECGETLPGALFEGSGFVLGSQLTFFNSGPFVPADDQWKTIDVSLNDYLGEKIYIKFDFFSLQGQNFYLDNVVIDGFTTGVEQLHDLEAATTVVPNPFEDGFDLQYQLPKSENLRVEIVDISGKVLYQEELGTISAGSHEHKLNSPAILNLSAGVYLLNLYTDKGRATKKLIKL